MRLTGPADPPVTHTYSAPGIYTVTVTATDAGGATGAPLTVTITVVGPCDAAPTTVATTVSRAPRRASAPATTDVDDHGGRHDDHDQYHHHDDLLDEPPTTSSTTTTSEPSSSTSSTAPTTALAPAGPTGPTESVGSTESEGPVGWASGLRSAVPDPCPSTPPVPRPPKASAAARRCPPPGTNSLQPPTGWGSSPSAPRWCGSSVGGRTRRDPGLPGQADRARRLCQEVRRQGAHFLTQNGQRLSGLAAAWLAEPAG